jgi:putative flippase GtrA
MKHLARFLLVGGLATALQFAIMYLLVRWARIDAVIASVTGFVVSALLNYQLNRVFTFGSDKPHRTALVRFATVAATGLCLNAASMHLLVNQLGLHYLSAQAITTVVVLAWNFILSKHWTFASLAPRQ